MKNLRAMEAPRAEAARNATAYHETAMFTGGSRATDWPVSSYHSVDLAFFRHNWLLRRIRCNHRTTVRPYTYTLHGAIHPRLMNHDNNIQCNSKLKWFRIRFSSEGLMMVRLPIVPTYPIRWVILEIKLFTSDEHRRRHCCIASWPMMFSRCA